MEKYIVFVASPSDVIRERNQVENVIKEINLTHGPRSGTSLNYGDMRKMHILRH